MKFFQIVLFPAFLLLIGQSLQAQSAVTQTDPLPKVVTDTLEVSGVCMMCKARIEEAAMYEPGVKFAEWTAATQQLVVVYKTKNTSVQQIAEAISQAGHDTKLSTATEDAYQKLPGCCKYRDGLEVH